MNYNENIPESDNELPDFSDDSVAEPDSTFLRRIARNTNLPQDDVDRLFGMADSIDDLDLA